ncbi:MAG: DEAD/DEAH box helicase family protein [Parcubacteria group bacterium]|nr:DEAD/DEAH box helicase family protein [Parcubacteria group bacterium]
MLDKQYFQTKDLILKVSKSVNPKVFDISKYEAFLDALCGDREYQKDAIRETLRYLLGQQHKNLRELAEENYKQSQFLQDKYSTFSDFEKQLQLPDHLSCSLDLATATGKSFVMYGIARIMLAEGAIDQALVLCPSNTIERGLADKFKRLSGDADLRKLLPKEAEIKNPRIIHATQTIQKGDIAIENIHATYATTKSAIEDSLKGKGTRTLVLNDEAHHIYSPTDKALKKWKEFLLDPKYSFHYVVGVTGTAYVGNDYFNDVVYQYTIREAIDERFIKTIDYAVEGVPKNEREKFQWILNNHEEARKKYKKVKPLTIIITQKIDGCEKFTDKWISFLSEARKISKKAAEEKILIVTSSPKHEDNVKQKLPHVDEKRNPVEFITSVSMLSEGWDVENVFQIVPHEERAFNSKLLIAQVLGRGLRIPRPYKGEQPVVTVFNHDKWSAGIKHLVQEVLEIERKVGSYIVPKKEDYNFSLYNIAYEKTPEETTYKQEKEYELLKKGYIAFSSQKTSLEKETTFERVISGERGRRKATIHYKMFSIAEVAQEIYNKLRVFDMDEGTSYAKKYSLAEIKKILEASLKKIGENKDQISEENKQKALRSFDVIKRRSAKSLRYRIKAEDLVELKTEDIKKTALGIGAFKRNGTLFYDDYSFKLSADEDKKMLKELEEMFDDGQLTSSSLVKVANVHFFRTPVNCVFSSSDPERKFIKKLVAENNAKLIDSWLKSRDVGFYSIEYAWRKGEHWKIAKFNPDVFLKIGKDIIVLELKMDDDVTDENKAKLKYAREHFEKLNELQKKNHYYFKFISPSDYDLFFESLKDKTYSKFKSSLEADLED